MNLAKKLKNVTFTSKTLLFFERCILFQSPKIIKKFKKFLGQIHVQGQKLSWNDTYYGKIGFSMTVGIVFAAKEPTKICQQIA